MVESNQHDHGPVRESVPPPPGSTVAVGAAGPSHAAGPSDTVDDGADPAAVYADLNALHWIIPLFGAVVGLGVLGLLVFQAFGGSENGPAMDNAAADVDTGADADQVTATAQGAAEEFARRFSDGTAVGLRFAFEAEAEVAADYQAITEGLGAHELTVEVGEATSIEDVRARVPLTLVWRLEEGEEFTTTGRLDVVQIGTEWLVDWSPGVLEETLNPGDRLVRERVAATRMPIIGQNDIELYGERPVVEISVLPRQAPAIRPLAEELATLLELDANEINDLISRSPSDRVLPITQRRPENIESVRGRLESIPGVVLTETTAPLAVYENLGRALLGHVGPATAEIIENEPDRFQEGDRVGRSGLQAVYNDRLSGWPGNRVRIDRRFPVTDGTGRPIPADDPINVVFLDEPEPGEPIRTTIDYEVQKWAEQALNTIGQPSSLVAIRPSTGEILAAANGPYDSSDNNALVGQYPPGSVFKIITAYGALERGVDSNQRIPCPPELDVDGRTFSNADDDGRGRIPMVQAFAVSCNTSFILLGDAIAAEDYPGLARRFGVGAEYSLGTSASSGSVPVPEGAVERAATAFGQGRVVVSPLSMAVMAAAVADGNYRPPVLVIGEETAIPSPPQALDGNLAGQLTAMMQAVVERGTGQALRGAPGGPVFGKTGTAEFGSGDQPGSHAWFVGFQGDLAFAVLVDGGGSGGAVAAPIAADFLARLHQ